MTQLWGADLTGGRYRAFAAGKSALDVLLLHHTNVAGSRFEALTLAPQQPLARVVMGGMLTSVALILWVLPLCYQVLRRFQEKASPQDPA